VLLTAGTYFVTKAIEVPPACNSLAVMSAYMETQKDNFQGAAIKNTMREMGCMRNSN
jgi:hypothetical protein